MLRSRILPGFEVQNAVSEVADLNVSMPDLKSMKNATTSVPDHKLLAPEQRQVTWQHSGPHWHCSRPPWQHSGPHWQYSGLDISHKFEVWNAAREVRNTASEVQNTAFELWNAAK